MTVHSSHTVNPTGAITTMPVRKLLRRLVKIDFRTVGAASCFCGFAMIYAPFVSNVEIILRLRNAQAGGF
jgi:hypothetical protein